jgi:hypothetical protein
VGSGNGSKESMLEFSGAAAMTVTTRSSGEVLDCRSFGANWQERRREEVNSHR